MKIFLLPMAFIASSVTTFFTDRNMQLQKFTIMKRYNLGNYEHEELSLDVGFSEGVTIEQADVEMRKARKLLEANSSVRIKEREEKAKTQK